jgi:hypothetical protein
LSDTLKHLKVSLVPDDPDTDLVRPSDWNHEHIFNGGVSGQYLQRYTGSTDGVQWADGEGFDVAGAASGGAGTSGNPWTGWEDAVEGRPTGSRIHFKRGYYSQAQEISMQNGWQVYGDNPSESVVTVANGIKGWTYSGSLGWANIYMHDLKIQGTSSAPGGTLALIDIYNGLHFTFERLHLHSSSTYAIRARAVINMTVNVCDIEAINLAGIYLGPDDPADIGTEFVNDWTVRYSFFQGVGANQLATDGFMRLSGVTQGEILGNAFEYGTFGVVLIASGRIGINYNFFEFQSAGNVVTTANASGGIEIAHNHLHNTADARVDLQFNVGSAAHDQLDIHDNAHVAFGGSHTSVTFFDPGATNEFSFKRNKLYPITSRGLLPVFYVAGYLPDNSEFFTSDVERSNPDPVLETGIRFGLSATSHLKYDEATGVLELAAIQASEELHLYGAATVAELLFQSFRVLFGATERLLLLTDGSMAIDERLFVHRNTTAIAGGDAGYLLGAEISGNRAGIYWGTGAPSIQGAKSSIYLNVNPTNISDFIYFNVDGAGTWRRLYGQLPVVLTANLPAAGAAQDGIALIEDAGAGDRNLIIYGGGERFRIDGGAAF